MPFLLKIFNIKGKEAFPLNFFLASLLFFSYAQVIQLTYIGLLQTFKKTIIRLLMPCVILSIILVSSLTDKQVPIYIVILAGCVMTGLGALFFSFRDNYLTCRLSRKDFTNLLIYSLPLLVGSTVVFVSDWVGRFIVGGFLGMRELGIFTAAVAVVQGVRLISRSLSEVLISTYAKINTYGVEATQKTFNLNVKMLAIMMFFITFLVFVYSDNIIYLIYGKGFADAAVALKILTFVLLIPPISSSVTALLMGTGFPKLEMKLSFIEAAFLIGLLIILTRYFNIAGAAFASVSALMMGAIIRLIVVTKSVKIRLEPSSLLGPTFTILFVVFVFLQIEQLLDRVFASLIVSLMYVLLIWRAAMTSKERDMMKNVMFSKF